MDHIQELSLYDIKSILVVGIEWPSGDCPKVAKDDTRLEYLGKAYAYFKNRDLRYNRKTHILSDLDGWLHKPSSCNPANTYPTYTKQDGLFEIARAVWCEAVRLYNIDHM